jgi:hypothetical protein
MFAGDDDQYNCSNLNDTNMQTWVVSQQECLFHDPYHFVLLLIAAEVATSILFIGLLTALACLKNSVLITAALVSLKSSAYRLVRPLLIPLMYIKNYF